MRILIIEDEKKTAAYLVKGLTQHGFTVDHADNGEDGLHLAQTQFYELIILDVMLPKFDGWEVLKRLRQTHPNIFVIYLTARDETPDKVKGFALGADDYLVKPFAFSELLARIRALQKRAVQTTEHHLSYADVTVDLQKHKVTRGNEKINLTLKEFNLLVLFMQRPGDVLSRTLIAELIWDINFESDTNVVDVAIRRLRHKLDDPFEVKLIHTRRGIGYVFEKV